MTSLEPSKGKRRVRQPTIDAELRQNIAETLRAAADNKEDRDQLALEFLERAWRRVAAESETQLPSQDRGALVAAA